MQQRQMQAKYQQSQQQMMMKSPPLYGRNIMSMQRDVDENIKEDTTTLSMMQSMNHTSNNNYNDTTPKNQHQQDSLFITRVANYYHHDDHEIPKDLEEAITRNVEKYINALCIGDIIRTDLKVTKNQNTGNKFIDAFVHLYWFDNASAKHAQLNLNEHGQFLCPTINDKVWVVRRNKNPMSPEEFRLMKSLGALIREMNATHERVKELVSWPELDQYINDIDLIIRHYQFELEQIRGIKSPEYSLRYKFMYLKYQRCNMLLYTMNRVIEREAKIE